MIVWKTHIGYAGRPRILLLVIVLVSMPYPVITQPIFNVKNYGAQGDGFTEDTRAVQAAINAARGSGTATVYFPASAGCYMVSGLTFYSNITYAGESQDVCIKSISGRTALARTPSSSPFSNARIAYLTLDGNANSFTGHDCLDLRGPTNVAIDHVTTTGCGEDGVYVTGWGGDVNPSAQGDGLLITNLNSSNNGRNGLSIIVGKNITVRDSLFENHKVSPPYAGVDVEPNTAAQVVQDITFENCTFRENAYNGLTAWEYNADRPHLNLRLIHCTFDGNGRDGAYIAASHHVISGIYVSGTMVDNGSRQGYRGGLDIWNANNVVVTNLTVAGAAQALFLWGVTGAMVANSTLSGSPRDMNINRSTDVVVLTSTSLAHEASSGSFSQRSGSAPSITTMYLDDATVGTAYSATLTATGDPEITWTQVTGNLPAGLALSSTGLIAGTPSLTGTFTFTLQAINALTYDQRTYTLTVSDLNVPDPSDPPHAPHEPRFVNKPVHPTRADRP
jgi:hypothetical protein